MKKGFPEKIRVSIGSAIVLGLVRGRLDAKPTTVYLLTYQPGKCHANCRFCPQAKTSRSRADMLSRVSWPLFTTEQVLRRIGRVAEKGAIKRVCVQALNYPTVFKDVLSLASEIKSRVTVPISISCQPLNRKQMKKLIDVGVNRVSIALDAATKELFDQVKGALAGGPYVWEEHCRTLKEAVKAFGKGSVTTHLIAGLGENEKEIVQTIQWCVDIGVYPSLFAFTPMAGTALEKRLQPSTGYYRKLQVAHFLITKGKTRYENMRFSEDGRLIDFGVPKEVVRRVIRSGHPFVTSGCPGCNRPYYNERPGGPIYNYPQQPMREDIIEIQKEIRMYTTTGARA